MATDILHIAAPADFHVHLRQGTFSELVTKHVRKGGFTLAYVMVGVVLIETDIGLTFNVAQSSAAYQDY